MKRILLKATRDTKLFKKGQKLWWIWGTGALAAFIITKYKGKGRWIRTWCHWPDPDDKKGRGFFCKPDCKWIGEVEITKEFNNYLNKLSDF